MSVPVFADYQSRDSYWNWLASSGSVAQKVIGYTTGKVCTKSSDGYHHANSYVTKKNGLYGCVCTECGKAFTAYETDIEQTYNKKVKEMPSKTYTSEGGMIWQPTHEDVVAHYWKSSTMTDWHLFNTLPTWITELENSDIGYKLTSTRSTTTEPLARGPSFRVSVKMPISGLYTPISGSTMAHGKVFYADGSTQEYVQNWSFAATTKYYKADVQLAIGNASIFDSAFSDLRGYVTFNISWFMPAFKVVPDAALDEVEYGIVTRPTSVSGGNYGIVGDNGQIVKIDNNSTIVNETNNTYVNPVTGESKPIEDWTYDYENRQYDVNLGSGNTSSVTYGDEHITITETITNNEGDKITNNYTIYYVTGDTDTSTPAPPDPPPAACVHDWVNASTTPATCTRSGSVAYKCSKCQQTKADTIPELGHDWQIKQSVKTEYDETGALVQEGYTIYECTRCKEQYKAASGASPPATPGIGGSGGIFTGIFGLLMDFLSFFWNTFKDFTTSGVKAFLSALADGTSDIFGLLNPFDWSA